MITNSPASLGHSSAIIPEEIPGSHHPFEHDSRWQVMSKNLRGAIQALVTYRANRRRVKRGDYNLRPLIASYYVTHRCNLKCLYCTEHYPIRDTVDLDTEGAFAVLKRLRREMSAIYFTGGEPLVRPDIVKILREARRLRFFPIHLGTNGLLLPLREEVLDYADRLIISLDSMNAASWDDLLNAGPGQARRIYEIIAHYAGQQRRRRVSIMVNCVITGDTIAEAYRVMEFCFRHDVVFAPVSATTDSLPDRNLLARADYQRLVRHVVELKRRGYPILGSMESIETLLLGRPFPCYATAIPHVYPNGDVFYPCQPLGRIGGNLLELGSVEAVYRAGERKFGAWKECWRGCALNCYVLSAFYMHHFWDQMVLESVAQFAMQPGTGKRLPADAALEPLYEDPASWEPTYSISPPPGAASYDVPLAQLSPAGYQRPVREALLAGGFPEGPTP
ncbi:MAG TPA: radical SAM protein [Candidatus Dormibacteraeota bacterium]|nr:radical SAM protein [Candidatus Dormibacteraeota bacterium]